MQFKSFMEALKGKQHKIDKNKNGQIDAHDFKLLRKEESEETTETIDESEERMARADYKVGASGRKSHKEIVFGDAESKEEDDKEEMKEAKMSDDDMAERERIVKGMKKNLAGFKARYGDRAKEVMYATATKQAMKEENVEEAMQKADVPTYLRKKMGDKPLTMADLRAVPKDQISHPHNLAIARGAVKEEATKYVVHYTNEKGEHVNSSKAFDDKAAADAHASKGNAMDKVGGKYTVKTMQNEQKQDVPFDGPYTKTKPVKNSDGTTQSPMSRARELAKQELKKQMKEDIDRLFEKDDSEYNYEGEMAVTQLKTICRHAEALQAKMQPDTNLPEWVQSKITLATDYMQTAHDYLMSEMDEAYSMDDIRRDAAAHLKKSMDKQSADRIAAHKNPPAKKGFFAKVGQKQINMVKGAYHGLTKEETALDEVEVKTLSYGDFISNLLEYETKDGRYVHKGSYGGSYSDPEGADDADDKKPKQQPAEKRGRGRPAGAKSGARKITGTSKLFK